MTSVTDDRRTTLLSDLANTSQNRDEAMNADFLELYFQHVLTDGLLKRHTEDLLGIVSSHRALARLRQPGQVLLQVLTPQVSTHGWGSGSTIVQVVADDAPYIVDSILTEVAHQGHQIRLLVHPQLEVTRDGSGALESVTSGPTTESWVSVELGRIDKPEATKRLVSRLQIVLHDVIAVADDRDAMTSVAAGIATGAELAATPQGSQIRRMLSWLSEDNFLFLGYCHYRAVPDDGAFVQVAESGLGILRDAAAPLAPELAQAVRTDHQPVLVKALERSTVQRDSPMDEIVIANVDPDGSVISVHRILGLFTAKAYNASIETTSFLDSKMDDVRKLSGFPADGYAARDLLSVLEEYPRDELFQADADYLCRMATRVVASRHLAQPLLFVRPDGVGRYISCVVFVPRERYDTSLRTRIEEILLESFQGSTVEKAVRLGTSPMAMARFVIQTPNQEQVTEDTTDQLESWVHATVRTWDERWAEAMTAEFGDAVATHLMEKWGPGLDEAYRATCSPRIATADVQQLERLSPDGVLANLHSEQSWQTTTRRLRLYCDRPIGLTELLPHLIKFGVKVVDERVHRIHVADGSTRYLLDFGLSADSAEFWGELGEPSRFLAGFLAVWQGRCESDGFNQLIGTAGLTWPQVVILRMIAAYLKQTTPYSRENIQAALVGQPEIAANLVAIFRARFRPGISSDARTTAQQEASDAVTVGLTRVPSLDHDRIIRRYREVIGAGLRTSFYQGNPDGTEPPPVIALKLNPQQLTYLPAPRPKFEIWVYGPTVEGVHLRFGRVARGGLRWSNRREDFRTEVLGLVKAQIVKNAVIVPTGAKGCFYPKHLPNPQTHRAAWLTAGRQAYKDFVTALLSVTDNLVGKELIPPAEVVRYDDDDSYLVVAADKGTATFSDVANRVALEKAFWLGDAFASGGSTGYNHKAMGITARGAWRSVIRHFSEIGVNPQTDDITVVGIGDMSGDVFGNGMLRSRHVRLIGAFDHRHIFIDPNPEAETSFDERQRLFNLPSSSWGDYSAELISDGGGVFARSAKSIPISPQMRGVLPILGEAEQATPAEVIQALLQAPVDLVWHGGIGTYVKASQEQNADIGDPANDAVRIDGSQLNCTVVGEGGNLGFSQLGRIEAAQHGIRINTDAIDNSAGVNTSDYEVNIKILLNRVVDEGDLTQRQRNDLLKSMTDEVAARVLRTNYNQNVLLGNARYLGEAMVGPQERLMQWFEERGQLDRDLEALPSSEELQRRARDGRGLTSPEFAVLVAYAKLSLTDDLLHGKLLDDPWFGRVLFDYFPHALDDLADAIAAHPLRREIIATQLANTIVNHGGITFVHRAIEETGTDPQQIARAFIILSEVFEMSEYLSAVEALDGIVPTAVQSELYLEFRRQLDRGVRHLLSRPAGLRTIDEEIQHYRRPVHDLRAELDTLLAAAGLERLRTRITELEVQGVPRDLARRVATLLYNVDAIEIVDRATQEDRAALDVAEIYFRMAEVIYLDTAQAMLPELPREGRWDAAARSSLRQELYRLTGALTAQVLETGGDDPAAQVNAWTQSHSPQLTGLASLVQQLSVEEAELGLGQVWALIRDTQRLVKVH